MPWSYDYDGESDAEPRRQEFDAFPSGVPCAKRVNDFCLVDRLQRNRRESSLMLGEIPSSIDEDLDAVDHLDQRLKLREWSRKAAAYRSVFKSRIINCRRDNVRGSAIIISHRVHADTANCLKTLRKDVGAQCELIFVSNGIAPDQHSEIYRHADIIVQLRINTGAYVARNIGSLFASGPILIFVEDDCIPYENLLSAHLDAHCIFNCISVRGAYEPKSDNSLNALAAHYDLGDQSFPQHVVSEGNASYRSDIFCKVGGWDDEIRFGGGGTDLALRLMQIEPDMRRQIYYPKARIRHDYAVNNAHLAHKRRRQVESFKRLHIKHGEYRLAKWLFRKYLPQSRTDLLRAYLLSSDDSGLPSPESKSQNSISISIIIEWRLGSSLIDLVLQLTKIRTNDCEILLIYPCAEMLQDAPDWLQVVHQAEFNEIDNFASAVDRACGDIVLLVDSKTDFSWRTIRCHINLHQEFDVIAVQGAVEAQVDCAPLAGHDCFPAYEFPALADKPVNVSYRRSALSLVFKARKRERCLRNLSIPLILSYFYPDARNQIYSPLPIVKWSTPENYNFGKNRHHVVFRNDALSDIASVYNSFFAVGGIVPRLGCKRESEARRAILDFIDQHSFAHAKLLLYNIFREFPEIVCAYIPLRFWSVLELSTIIYDRRYGQSASDVGLSALTRYRRENFSWFSLTNFVNSENCHSTSGGVLSKSAFSLRE